MAERKTETSGEENLEMNVGVDRPRSEETATIPARQAVNGIPRGNVIDCDLWTRGGGTLRRSEREEERERESAGEGTTEPQKQVG